MLLGGATSIGQPVELDRGPQFCSSFIRSASSMDSPIGDRRDLPKESEHVFGNLAGGAFRSLRWMVDLRLLPDEGSLQDLLPRWVAQLGEQRARYENLSARMRCDPVSTPGDADDLVINNPLSTAEEVRLLLHYCASR
jgi:hypothetical protein